MRNNDKKDFKFMCILCLWTIIIFSIGILFGSEEGILVGHLFCCLIAFPLLRNKKFLDWFNKE